MTQKLSPFNTLPSDIALQMTSFLDVGEQAVFLSSYLAPLPQEQQMATLRKMNHQKREGIVNLILQKTNGNIQLIPKWLVRFAETSETHRREMLNHRIEYVFKKQYQRGEKMYAVVALNEMEDIQLDLDLSAIVTNIRGLSRSICTDAQLNLKMRYKNVQVIDFAAAKMSGKTSQYYHDWYMQISTQEARSLFLNPLLEEIKTLSISSNAFKAFEKYVTVLEKLPPNRSGVNLTK